MQIQISSDHSITVHGAESAELQAAVTHALRHCSEHVMHVLLHLSDQNGNKGGAADKCCAMEARIQGRPSLAVTGRAASVGQSVALAAEKMARLIDHTLGRAARAVAPQD